MRGIDRKGWASPRKRLGTASPSELWTGLGAQTRAAGASFVWLLDFGYAGMDSTELQGR